MEELKNKIIGDYQIISYEYNKNNNNYFKVKCNVCGNIKIIGMNNIRKQNMNHSKLNCKENYYKYEYVGKNFGDYMCINFKHDFKKGFFLILECKQCNNKIVIKEYQLREIKHSPMTCRKQYYNNIIGKNFGDMKVIEHIGIINSTNLHYFKTKCNICGRETKINIQTLLNKPWIHSKRCWELVENDEFKKTIGQRYEDMNQRCNNMNHNNYKHYGGRGIKLEYDCQIDLYDDFIEEIKEHSEIHGIYNSTFDRIDVDGNYCKENLRIATKKIQSTNTRRMKIFVIEKNGKLLLSNNPMGVGRVLNINGRSIGNCLRGQSKSCGGWRVVEVFERDCDLQKIKDKYKIDLEIII